MKPDDLQLRSLLRRWKDIEPRGDFEANVRRRIRLAATNPRREWLLELFLRPAFAIAAALMISTIIGAFAGISNSRRASGQRAEIQFMSAGTLAGGYARLSTEAKR